VTAASAAEEARQLQAMQRAQMASAASTAATAAATGSREQPGTSNNSWLSKAAARSVERHRTAYAKAVARGMPLSSHQQARSSIVQAAQNMVQQGQRLVEVAAHEHAAGMELIAAGELLASTIEPPGMPPELIATGDATAVVPVAPWSSWLTAWCRLVVAASLIIVAASLVLLRCRSFSVDLVDRLPQEESKTKQNNWSIWSVSTHMSATTLHVMSIHRHMHPYILEIKRFLGYVVLHCFVMFLQWSVVCLMCFNML
jgi:hypothetical protein